MDVAELDISALMLKVEEKDIHSAIQLEEF
jgi:hypothetical protein